MKKNEAARTQLPVGIDELMAETTERDPVVPVSRAEGNAPEPREQQELRRDLHLLTRTLREAAPILAAAEAMRGGAARAQGPSDDQMRPIMAEVRRAMHPSGTGGQGGVGPAMTEGTGASLSPDRPADTLHDYGGSSTTTITLDQFSSMVAAAVEAKFAEVMATKPAKGKHITYLDAVTLSQEVRNVFRDRLGMVPPQIEATCRLSEAVMAPTLAEKKKLVKSVLGIAGGTGGLAMVIAGIGMGLGWGAGAIASAVAFFCGSSLAGPIGWVAGGVALAAVAGYFAMSSDDATRTERFLNCLKGGLREAMPTVWQEHGDRLGCR